MKNVLRPNNIRDGQLNEMSPAEIETLFYKNQNGLFLGHGLWTALVEVVCGPDTVQCCVTLSPLCAAIAALIEWLLHSGPQTGLPPPHCTQGLYMCYSTFYGHIVKGMHKKQHLDISQIA